MNILLMAPQPFYTQRGTPIAIRNLATVLGQAGHQVDLLTYADGKNIDLPNTRIIRVWKIPFMGHVPVGFSVKKLAYDFLMLFLALWLVIRKRYDVIHAVEESVYIGLLWAPLRRSRLVYDMDSSMADQLLEKWPGLHRVYGMLNWFEGFAVKHSTRVIAVCESLRSKARGYSDNVPVDLLTDTVLELDGERPDEQELLRDSAPDGHKLLLYIGNLEHYQGVDMVIEAMAKVNQNVTFMVIGGNADDIERCQSLAYSLDIADKILFMGPRPVHLLMDYLEQADILVSPRTKGVNTPMKIYSYLGAGVPLIATSILSHTQVLNDANSCLVEADPASMAAGIIRILADPEYAKRIASQALADAEQQYSFAAFRNKLLEIYKSMENNA